MRRNSLRQPLLREHLRQGPLLAGYHGHRAVQARRSTDPRVSSEEPAVQSLCQNHVRRVIGSQVVTQLPKSLEHRKRAMTRDPEAAIAFEQIPSRAAVQLATTDPTANRACDLRVQ